jgi:hypothetical protein
MRFLCDCCVTFLFAGWLVGGFSTSIKAFQLGLSSTVVITTAFSFFSLNPHPSYIPPPPPLLPESITHIPSAELYTSP